MITKWINKIDLTLIIFGLCMIIVVTCTKIEREPKVETGIVTDVTINSAKSIGNIIDLGDGISEHGHCWSLNPNPTFSGFKTSLGRITRIGSFTSVLQNLSPGAQYYIKAYVKNSDSQVYYSGESSFTTASIALPALTTAPVTSITSTTATTGGNISSDGGATITARGVCWSTGANPTVELSTKTTDGTGTGSFTSSITGLTANTTYYIRAYATNSMGIAYGNELSFETTNESGTFIDSRDNNIYKWVKIGTQVWMAENLAYLPDVSQPSVGSIDEPYFYVYDYYGSSISSAKSTSNYLTYGVLYNWPAAMNKEASSNNTPSGVKGACPDGWHLPSDSEWKELELFLGMTLSEVNLEMWRGSDQGLQLKSSSGWYGNYNGNNVSGFTALPGGCCDAGSGTFENIGYIGAWWSTSIQFPYDCYAYRRGLGNVGSISRDYYPKQIGISIRCVKN